MKIIIAIIFIFYNSICFCLWENQVNVLTGEFVEETIDLSLPGPFGVKLHRTYEPIERSQKKIAAEWQFNLPDLFEADDIQNTSQVLNYEIETTHDNHKRLSEVRFFTRNDFLDKWQISYEPSSCTITSSLGDALVYTLNKGRLEKVVKNGAFICSYAYITHPLERKHCISEKTFANGKRLSIEYYFADKTSFSFGKVKSITLFKKDHTQVCFYSYSKGVTEVTFPNGLKKKYFFNTELEALEEWDNENLLKKEQFTWDAGNLIRKDIYDANGLKHYLKFEYDTNGNLSKETFVGNLTGSSEGNEAYSKFYTYSKEGKLLKEQEENGKGRIYEYDPLGNVSAIFFLDHEKVLKKSVYHYDNCSLLTKEVHDNEEICYGPFHALGMPLIITEKRYDPETQAMRVVKQHKLIYSVQGMLLEEMIHDETGSLLKENLWHYDEFGKHLHCKEKNNEHYFSYDASHRLTYEWHCEKTYETFYHYDFKSIIEIEKKYFNGENEKTTFCYDERGNLTSFCDYLGNVTEYFYDNQNRKIATKSPAMNIEPLCSQFFYDTFNHLTKTLLPSGDITTISFNSRGQPLSIQYPDGVEEFRYYLDGRLKEEYKRDKQCTSYQYDALDNIVKKKQLGNDMSSIEVIEYGFRGTSLLYENSSLHGLKFFSYDHCGNISQIESKNHHLIGFVYDSKGTLLEKHELWEQFPELSKSTYFTEYEIAIYNYKNECFFKETIDQEKEIVEKKVVTDDCGQSRVEKNYYDADGNQYCIQYNFYEYPLVEVKKDPFGKELYKKLMSYDEFGNKISEIYQTSDQELTTKWVYSAFNRLEETIEAFGTPLQKSHRYFYNHLGQFIEIVKPDGVSLFYEYDFQGHVSRHYSSDHTIDYSFAYDLKGNLIQAIDHVLKNTTQRTYNDDNLLVSETLGNHLLIKNEYDIAGRRSALYLYDGSSVVYEYGSLFLEKVVRNSKEGYSLYSHTFKKYDLQGNVLIEGMIGNLGEIERSPTYLHTPYHSSQREDNQSILKHPNGSETAVYRLDSAKQVISENGPFEKEYFYDSFGNTQKQKHNLLSQNCEAEYDLNGNLTYTKKNGDAFHYTFDALNRLIGVKRNGNLIVRYCYDCCHRRIAEIKDQETHFFLYDGLNEIGKVARDGTLQELRILGEAQTGEAHQTLAIELHEEAFAPLHDVYGSIVGLVSLKNKCVEEFYCYSAFGQEKIIIGTSIKNPWRYFAKRKDSETGLIFFGRRFYDPLNCNWLTPDPAGYQDGPNLYQFAKNNPLLNSDAYGLFSFKSLWNFVRHPFQHLDHFFGKAFHYLCGYYIEENEPGIYGGGEVNDKVRVSFINGMVTDEYWLLIAAKGISYSHGGVNVHYVHRPPSSLIFDAVRAFMVKYGYISPHARHLATMWKGLIQDMGGPEGGGTIIHYAHSIGTCETMAALRLLSEEEQQMIKVYSFGSPSLSSKNYQIHHFISVRDGICLLDFVNLIKAARGKNPDVTFVGSFFGIPGTEHLFGSKSYMDIWSAMGKTFVEWYGSLT